MGTPTAALPGLPKEVGGAGGPEGLPILGFIVQRCKSLAKCRGSRSIYHDGVTMGNYDLLVSTGHLSSLVMILRDVSCLKNIEDMTDELVGINLSIWVIHGHQTGMTFKGAKRCRVDHHFPSKPLARPVSSAVSFA